jgi:DNA-binding NarL/FixJ family response regulator
VVRRYLVVEDDAAFARTVARQLRHHGRVSIAYTAAEAVEMLGREPGYCGLVLDVSLPDGSGLDLLRDIRESGDDTPALVLTSLDGLDVIATAQRHSATFLRKPAHADNLRAFVEQTRSHERIVKDRLRATVAMLARRHGLTRGQEHFLLAAASGVVRRDLAEALGIGESTVKAHVARVLRHTGTRTLTEAVALVHRELFRDAS